MRSSSPIRSSSSQARERPFWIAASRTSRPRASGSVGQRAQPLVGQRVAAEREPHLADRLHLVDPGAAGQRRGPGVEPALTVARASRTADPRRSARSVRRRRGPTHSLWTVVISALMPGPEPSFDVTIDERVWPRDSTYQYWPAAELRRGRRGQPRGRLAQRRRGRGVGLVAHTGRRHDGDGHGGGRRDGGHAGQRQTAAPGSRRPAGGQPLAGQPAGALVAQRHRRAQLGEPQIELVVVHVNRPFASDSSGARPSSPDTCPLPASSSRRSRARPRLSRERTVPGASRNASPISS